MDLERDSTGGSVFQPFRFLTTYARGDGTEWNGIRDGFGDGQT